MDKANLSKRLVTALVLAGVFIALDLAAAFFSFGRVMLALLGLVAIGIAAYEGARMGSDSSPIRAVVIAVALVLPPLAVFASVVGLVSHAPASPLLAAVAMSSVIGMGAVALSGRTSLEQVQQVIARTAPLFILVSLGGASLLALVAEASGARIIFWLVVVVAVNDIAAMIAGSFLRGPRLAPAISPNKTVSGSCAGLLAGVLIGAASSGLLFAPVTATGTALFAAAVVISAQLGDLAKSLTKRLAGYKDSGSILPGHGGVLDRIDGILGGALLLFPATLFGWMQ